MAEEKEEEVGHEEGTVPTVYTVTRTKTWRNGTSALCKSVKRLKDSPHALPWLRSSPSLHFRPENLHISNALVAIHFLQLLVIHEALTRGNVTMKRYTNTVIISRF